MSQPLSPALAGNSIVLPAGWPALFTHVRRARKARPEHGIAVGTPYYWWYDRQGTQQFSLTEPAPEAYLWPERLAAIEAEHTRRRQQREAEERAAELQRQRRAWTQAFADEYFQGHFPRGSSDGQKAANWKPGDPGPAPRADARVSIVDNPRPSRGRWAHKEVTGEPAEVAAFIQYFILSDTCTPYYEHMLWGVGSVVSMEPLVVTLSCSTLAGD